MSGAAALAQANAQAFATGAANTAQSNAQTYTNAFASNASNLTSGTLATSLLAGLSATVALAKLTVGGTNGSITFTNGLLTSKVDPT
jgi:hypothetical protein